MPMYYWEDKLTGYGIEILRSFKEYKDEPKDSDLPAEERGKKRDWVRLLKGAPQVTKAPGFGKKGYW